MKNALLVIDMQKDFCPGGALAVTGGDEIVAGINAAMFTSDLVVLTQDWHPEDHLSLAPNHPGKSSFETVDMPYGPQILWPAHCLIGSEGAAFHDDLDLSRADLILRKGSNPKIDSYSAFFENDKETKTGLEGYLRDHGVEAVTLMGLAQDFCVAWSAVDAARLGLDTSVALDLTRAIDTDGSKEAALANMRAAGVTFI
ncbi:bifunctional nicotinamidase/pyrazinamidase [Paracoccaceae bacterium GXU_MW_L88]